MRAIHEAAARAVLLHGNDLCGEFYRPLAGELAARGVRTVLPTLPGFGGEPTPPPAAASWDAYAAAIAALFEASCPEGGVLIGHSMGGLFALLAAARRPRGLRALVLLEPAIYPSRALARAGARQYTRDVVYGPRGFQNWSGTSWRVHRPEAFPPAAFDHYVTSRGRADTAHVAALFAALPDLYPLPFSAVRVPVLILRGAGSGWRVRLGLALLARRFPDARRRTVPGCAHFMANEADAAIAAEIAEFLEARRI